MIIPPPLLDFSSDKRGKEMKNDKESLQVVGYNFPVTLSLSSELLKIISMNEVEFSYIKII